MTHAGVVVFDRTTARGRIVGDIVRFHGIPYAAPPVGTRRFRAPEPSDGEAGPLDCTTPTPPASQLQPGLGPVGSDDCLRLTVTAPLDRRAPLPVLVWIHGGGFTAGSADEPHCDPSALVRRGMVVVSVAYRLGALGWLRLAHVDAHHGDGNLGLLDQAAALRWVFEHIDRFGGDPHHITLAGQSAGAMSVASLLAAPGLRPPLAGAILQSGAGDHVITVAEAEDVAARVAAAAGLTDPADLLHLDTPALLRAQSVAEAGLATDQAHRPNRLLMFSPVSGTGTVPLAPVPALRSMEPGLPPVLVGATFDEMQAFPGPAVDASGLRRWLEANQPADAHHLLDAYLSRAGGDPTGALSAMRTDLLFRFPGVRFARTLARRGAPAWHYDLRWRSSLPGFGAAHSLDLRFTFDTARGADAGLTHGGAPESLLRAVPAHWTSFVLHGDPNQGGITGSPWPRFHETGPTRLFDAVITDHDDATDGLRAAWGPQLAPD